MWNIIYNFAIRIHPHGSQTKTLAHTKKFMHCDVMETSTRITLLRLLQCWKRVSFSRKSLFLIGKLTLPRNRLISMHQHFTAIPYQFSTGNDHRFTRNLEWFVHVCGCLFWNRQIIIYACVWFVYCSVDCLPLYWFIRFEERKSYFSLALR